MPVLFDGFSSLIRVGLTVIPVYVLVVILIRVSGKRVTSKMNNFDWFVTVAVGSIVGSTVILRDVVILDALVAITMFFGLQYVVTWLSVRSDKFERLIKAEPTLLFHDGRYCNENMRRERVTKKEIAAAVREHGEISMGEIAAVIFENDAKLSVIPATAKNLDNLKDFEYS